MLEFFTKYLIKEGYQFIEVNGKRMSLADYLNQMKDPSVTYILDLDSASRRLVFTDMQGTIKGYIVDIPY